MKHVAGLEPADDAAGNGAGDLLHANEPPGIGFLQIDPELLVASRAADVARVQESTREVADRANAASARQAVDVHVEHRKKDADPERPAGGKVGIGHFFNMSHGAVGGTNQGGGIRGDRTLGIAKKRDDEGPQRSHHDHRQPQRPVDQPGADSKQDR